jgi:hypothetical protein
MLSSQRMPQPPPQLLLLPPTLLLLLLLLLPLPSLTHPIVSREATPYAVLAARDMKEWPAYTTSTLQTQTRSTARGQPCVATWSPVHGKLLLLEAVLDGAFIDVMGSRGGVT